MDKIRVTAQLGAAIVHEDGSVFAPDGQYAYVSAQRFIKSVCDGDCCFICLASPHEKTFNNEHVLPNWILRRQRLHNKTINLMDGTRHRYGTYTIPCCLECNTRLGRLFEGAMSKTFAALFEPAAMNRPDSLTNLSKMFQWLALIFIKVHLKDRKLFATGTAPLDWAELHHVYCIARAAACGVEVNPEVMGSIWLFNVPQFDEEEFFDYADVTYAKTMMLRVGSCCCIVVFDDGCAVVNSRAVPSFAWSEEAASLQLREVTEIAAYGNLLLSERPTFHTAWNPQSGRFSIERRVPANPPNFGPTDSAVFRKIRELLFAEVLDPAVAQEFLAGGRTFLT